MLEFIRFTAFSVCYLVFSIQCSLSSQSKVYVVVPEKVHSIDVS